MLYEDIQKPETNNYRKSTLKIRYPKLLFVAIQKSNT